MRKNLQKSTTSGVAAAIATLLAKVVVSHGWAPADTEPYLLIIVTGACVGIYDFLRHSVIVQRWMKKITTK